MLGTTGIETAEIVESITKSVKPDVLIVIDSLLSQSVDRLGKTIQISDRGIVPGAGVENARKGIKEKNINIPVIAIGAPLVVESATITTECIELIIDNIKKEENLKTEVDILKEKYDYEKIKELMNIKDYNMIVVPKDIDELVLNVSKIIAGSINMLK